MPKGSIVTLCPVKHQRAMATGLSKIVQQSTFGDLHRGAREHATCVIFGDYDTDAIRVTRYSDRSERRDERRRWFESHRRHAEKGGGLLTEPQNGQLLPDTPDNVRTLPIIAELLCGLSQRSVDALTM